MRNEKAGSRKRVFVVKGTDTIYNKGIRSLEAE